MRWRLGLVIVVAVVSYCGLVARQVSWGAEPQSPAAAIDGFRFEFPCKNPMPENPKQGADCFSALVKGDPMKTDNFTVVKKFGGEEGKRYKVTLRFRGVVEPMMYKGGEQVGEYFYIGGEKNNATYNVYQISVSSPQSHYFLNRQDKVGHQIFTIDYTQTIEIDGGATITLHGDGQNGRLISNFKKLVVDDLCLRLNLTTDSSFRSMSSASSDLRAMPIRAYPRRHAARSRSSLPAAPGCPWHPAIRLPMRCLRVIIFR